MHINLEEDKLNLDKKLNKFNKLYDYIIIGSGPAASVILNNLIKKKKKYQLLKEVILEKKLVKN